MKHRFSGLLACGLLAASIGSAQTTITTPTNFISSAFGATVVSGTTQTSIAGTVAYDLNLSPVSLYVGAQQLSADAQALFAAYPSPQDPIEAIVASIMSSILQKYPQINGGTMSLSVFSVASPAGSKGTAIVYMGTLGPSSHSQTSAAMVRNAATPATPSRP